MMSAHTLGHTPHKLCDNLDCAHDCVAHRTAYKAAHAKGAAVNVKLDKWAKGSGRWGWGIRVPLHMFGIYTGSSAREVA
jgi:hypothetical protein